MTKEYLNEVIKKVENRGEDNYNIEKVGKIIDFDIIFNERFPDFDFYVSVEEQDYSYGIKSYC